MFVFTGSSHITPASAEEVARVIAMTQQNVVSKTKPQDTEVDDCLKLLLIHLHLSSLISVVGYIEHGSLCLNSTLDICFHL